jgi:uridine kinase
MNRAELLDHLAKVVCAVERPHPLRVAIDGVDAAGKRTIACELIAELRRSGQPVIQSSTDGFHNPRTIRYRRGSTSPEGYFHDSFDYRAITEYLLIPLGPGGNRRYRTAVFDYRSDQTVEVPFLTAPKNAVLVFDGIFLQRPELAGYWDISIFVDVSTEIALARAENRYMSNNGKDERSNGVHDLHQRYLIRYIPAQKEYLESCHPDEVADILIDNNNLASPVIIRSRL